MFCQFYQKNRVGCPMKRTFGIVEGAFEVFGRNKMYLRYLILSTHILSHLVDLYKSRVPCTKVLSQSTSGFGFFLYHSKDLDEPDKPVTSVFLISQHMKSYKPSKKWSYLRLGLFSVCTKVLSFSGF